MSKVKRQYHEVDHHAWLPEPVSECQRGGLITEERKVKESINLT